MYPILVKIGPLTIHTYGFLMAVGVACGLWFIYVQAKGSGLDAVRIMDAAFYTIIISLVGAKLVLFLSNAGYYVSYPRELFSLARSGGVFQGGLLFGTVFALWYFHFALHQRTDVAVLSKELLSYAWYREMVGSAYPSLSLPGSPIFMETIIRTNPQRPACDIQYNGRAEIECTKPLAADP